MTETRFALPVRSPTPFIVPCTWRRAGLDRRQRVGDRAVGVVVAVDAERDARQRRADLGDDPRDRRRQRAAVRVAQDEPLGARLGGRAQAVERELPGRRRSRRRSARRRTARACRSAARNATESAIIARFSSRDVRTTFSTCRTLVLPTIVVTGAKHSASVRRPGVLGRGDVAPAGHPEGGDRRPLERLALEQREQLGLLGVRRREARLDEVDAELVEPADDAQLLVGGQADARPAHPVAQRRVVELDRGLGHVFAATGTGSSHSR